MTPFVIVTVDYATEGATLQNSTDFSITSAFLAINYAIVPAISSQMWVRSEYRERLQALERFQLAVEGKRRYEKKFAEAEGLYKQLQQRLLPGEKLTLAAADHADDAAQGG